jgi:hypothetical protein
MKKFAFTFLAVLLFLPSHAQTIYIRAGVNLASLNYKFNGASLSTDNVTGIHIGAAIATQISSKMVFQYGLSYSELLGDISTKKGFVQASTILKYHPIKDFNLSLGVYGGLKLANDPLYSTDFGLIPGMEFFFDKNVGLSASYLLGFDEVSIFNAKTRAIQAGLIFRINSRQLKNAGY